MSDQESRALARYRLMERWRARTARLAAKRWRQYDAGQRSIEAACNAERIALIARRELWEAEVFLQHTWSRSAP